MKYTVTLAIETPHKHFEDIEFNRDLFTHGIIEESYPNYTQEEFILEMTKRLSNAYRTRDGSFFWMDGMIDGVWFTIVPDINDPYLNATVYDFFLREEKRQQAEFESSLRKDEEGVKQQTITLQVPHGLAIGSNVRTEAISDKDNRSTQ